MSSKSSRLKKLATSEYEGLPERNATDAFGRIQWEHQFDDNGEPIMELQYKVRYLRADGTQISKEEYEVSKLSGEEVYRAAFVGCTYHCG